MTAPRFFTSAAVFRRWLVTQHARRAELWLGFRKVHVRPRGITYSEALESAGRMTVAGRAAFEARTAKRSGIYAFEQRRPGLDAPSLRAVRANAKAWSCLAAQPPWYQRTAGHWVTSAKRVDTRARRLEALIRDSARGRRIGPLQWPKPVAPSPKRAASKAP